MLKEFEKDLLLTLKDFNARSYLGEFEEIEKLKTCINGEETLVFVDFVGEKFTDLEKKSATFKIYLLTHTSSKATTHRVNAKHKLFDTLELIDEKLKNAELNNGFRIELKELKKIHEGISEHGYLSVYAREIETLMLKEDCFLTLK
ncbi:hypothetical protein B6S12_09920 [Helicobacter valdiviensis]|uniref:Uncharacterized protein n=1 Tax=Helicobacter valdiviensis TaxID=1458358 RepID=A0A2W6MRU4_9HELI|nr:hypothetical protein [Helicobacter valdiviensis]PZT47275.1 hypothetical protein B6S12_09920 [Helicobacter valdiviensis]